MGHTVFHHNNRNSPVNFVTFVKNCPYDPLFPFQISLSKIRGNRCWQFSVMSNSSVPHFTTEAHYYWKHAKYVLYRQKTWRQPVSVGMQRRNMESIFFFVPNQLNNKYISAYMSKCSNIRRSFKTSICCLSNTSWYAT